MEVIAYTRNDDPYSQMLKNILQSNKIAFENKEVSRDAGTLQEMKEASGQEKTPVLVIDGKAYCGFDREMIKEVLQLTQDKGE